MKDQVRVFNEKGIRTAYRGRDHGDENEGSKWSCMAKSLSPTPAQPLQRERTPKPNGREFVQ